jgi:hypothetical protein
MASKQQELRNITTKVLRALGEGQTMASKQTDELNKLYLEWVAALKANPEMPLDELRHMFEQWGGSPASRAASITSKPMPGEFRPYGRYDLSVCML